MAIFWGRQDSRRNTVEEAELIVVAAEGAAGAGGAVGASKGAAGAGEAVGVGKAAAATELRGPAEGGFVASAGRA